jgi:hypothetical protein
LNILSDDQQRFLAELRKLFRKVRHVATPQVTVSQAQRYAQLAESLVAQLRAGVNVLLPAENRE